MIMCNFFTFSLYDRLYCTNCIFIPLLELSCSFITFFTRSQFSIIVIISSQVLSQQHVTCAYSYLFFIHNDYERYLDVFPERLCFRLCIFLCSSAQKPCWHCRLESFCTLLQNTKINTTNLENFRMVWKISILSEKFPVCLFALLSGQLFVCVVKT